MAAGVPSMTGAVLVFITAAAFLVGTWVGSIGQPPAPKEKPSWVYALEWLLLFAIGLAGALVVFTICAVVIYAASDEWR